MFINSPYRSLPKPPQAVLASTRDSKGKEDAFYYPSRTYRRAGRHFIMQMEKLLLVQQQRDMELMKTAMLKHEETFRQQVHDLHRLYRIQKQLMSDLARRPSTVLLPCQQGQRRGHQSRRSHIVGGGGCEVPPPSRDSEDELELTLAVGSGGGRKQRKRWDNTTPSTTPVSSADSSGAALRALQHNQRVTACDLREGVIAKQPQWLLQCLSLRMA